MTNYESNAQQPGTAPPMMVTAKKSAGVGGPQGGRIRRPGKDEKWGRGRTIIVADDEDIVRHLIQEVLLHDGFRVLPCENDEIALALCACEEFEVDALLADYHLGRRSGLWLARRALEHLPDLRIVLMSGDLAVRSRVRSAELQAIREVLIKPFGVRALRNSVRKALEG